MIDRRSELETVTEKNASIINKQIFLFNNFRLVSNDDDK